LNIEYEEENNVLVLGIFLLGRSIPKLYFKTGITISEIGNSAEILRYLWGSYSEILGGKIHTSFFILII
jgi:hypothetical protein